MILPQTQRRILAITLLFVLGGGFVWWWHHDQETTDDAFVDGHIHALASRVPGYVQEVPVAENQIVEAGQVLVVLDPTDFTVAVAQARADLAAAEAQLAAASTGVPLQANQTELQVASSQAALASAERSLAQARAEVAATRTQVEGLEAAWRQAERDLARQTQLRTQDLTPEAALEAARTTRDQAKAAWEGAHARLHAAQAAEARAASEAQRAKAALDLAATGQSVTTIKDLERRASQARVELARARLHQAELQLEYTRITAPVRGQVTKKRVEAGAFVGPGTPLMAIVPLEPEALWVTANFKESQIGQMRPGQKVDIAVDALPGVVLHGQVESIMAGTGAVFSLFPPENALGNYVKVVQRVPVRIALDPFDPKQIPLRLGLSVVPTVYINKTL